MCGIIGILSSNREDHSKLDFSTNLLAHRGPDDRGTYFGNGISLGHRRLAIIDLSPNGRQPMSNEDSSIFLVCNGEIYNYLELTQDLKKKGHCFRSKCDCETLIHLYEEYGEAFLERVNGMFAICLWDDRERKLIAAVDRFGKRPLYFTGDGNRLVLASEMKALLAFPWVRRTVNQGAIDRFLTFRYIPAPQTIFQGIQKLEMATMMVVRNGGIKIRNYWEAEPEGKICSQEQFESILVDAVRLRMQSDVPLGMYLSGGIDSAVVASIMSQFSGNRRVSYTVGFDNAFDERPRAAKIAEYLGFDHFVQTITENEFDYLSRIQYHLDEPFGDLLCLPAYTLAKAAKEHLTVVLTGDGADEILNGYFHQKLMIMRDLAGRFLDKRRVRSMLGKIFENIPCSVLNRFFDYPDSLEEREKKKFLQALLGSNRFGRFYEAITSCFSREDKERMYHPDFAGSISEEPLEEVFQAHFDRLSAFPLHSKLSLLDIQYWIPFSVVFRLDKMNMAHAVETRSPFLDYRVVQSCLRIPPAEKLSFRGNKLVLRKMAEKRFPSALQTRGKQAFYFPKNQTYQKRWLSWSTELIHQASIKKRGIFRWAEIRDLISEAEGSSMLATRQLTSLAMLESWFQTFVDSSPISSGVIRSN